MFPDFVYKKGGKHVYMGGVTYDYKSVKNQAELDKALADGWFKTRMEALEEKVVIDEISPPSRDELETKARELGLKFDGRTGDKKLNTLIEDALRGK